jgi:hypothetical protein
MLIELVSLMADEDREVNAIAAKKEATAAAKTVPSHRRAALVKLANRSMRIGKTSMAILLLPALLYYVVESRLRAAAFLAGIMIAYNYLFRRHLGQAETKIAKQYSMQTPSGKMLMRFPVDLGRLVAYLERKRAESELEMTFTHIVLKACAMVLLEMPALNGHVIMKSFYRSKARGVDLSVALDLNSHETVAYKVEDADAKPLELIADEVSNVGKTLRSGGELEHRSTKFFDKLDAMLPGFLAKFIQKILYNLGAKLGISLPSLGIYPHPLGVCTVVNSTKQDRENDMDLAMLPDLGDAYAPITVTMSGMRVLPDIDGNKQVSGSPVLNFSVCMSTYAATAVETRKFCVRLQDLLRDPDQIDKLHQRADFDRQETAKRAMFFGKAN